MAIRKSNWFAYLKIAFDRQRGYVSFYQLALNFQILFSVGGGIESWMVVSVVALMIWAIIDVRFVYPSEQATNYDNHPLKIDIARLEGKIDKLEALLAKRMASYQFRM